MDTWEQIQKELKRLIKSDNDFNNILELIGTYGKDAWKRGVELRKGSRGSSD